LSFVSADHLVYVADGQSVKVVDTSGLVVREIPVNLGSGFPHAARIAVGAGVLVVGSLADTVEVWDTRSWERRAVLAGHSGGVRSLAISPEAGIVATASSKPKPSVRLWRLATGEPLGEIGLSQTPDVLVFSPDGRRLALSSSGTVHVWSVPDRTLERSIAVHPMFSVFDVAFTQDGGGLVTCRSHPQLWDLATGQMLRHFGPFTDLCHSVSVSPDGRHAVTTSMGSDVRVWEIATGAFYQRLGRNMTARY
jgi:WD40 repeat protein